MCIKKISTFSAVLVFLTGLPAESVRAQSVATTQPAGIAATVPAVVLHPWQAALPRLVAEAYFTNLKNGDKIETPYVAKFGLSGGWGLAPISSASTGKSGHHHLLVNRDLPLDFKQPVPFSEQYIHFGKGQMETALNLVPGTYTLRLLLADSQHLPRFVYSKPLTITVTRKNDVDPKSLIKKGISINVADDNLTRPFRVQFHASGLNVAHLAQQEKDTGHFRLSVVPKTGAKAAEMDFVNGQTEVWLEPPAGDYTLKLEFVDNVNPGQVLESAAPKTIKVL